LNFWCPGAEPPTRGFSLRLGAPTTQQFYGFAGLTPRERRSRSPKIRRLGTSGRIDPLQIVDQRHPVIGVRNAPERHLRTSTDRWAVAPRAFDAQAARSLTHVARDAFYLLILSNRLMVDFALPIVVVVFDSRTPPVVSRHCASHSSDDRADTTVYSPSLPSAVRHPSSPRCTSRSSSCCQQP
jgi:hypothetical protein